MTAGLVKKPKLEKHVEKQMGCMSGFLQIFDRHQLPSRKRLPPSLNSQVVNSSLESNESIVSVETSRESENQQMVKSPTMMEHRYPLPEAPNSMAENQPKSALALPVLEFKEGTRSSWKFAREAPRLSLDSRATTDAKGSLHPREIRTNSAGLSADRCDNSTEGDDSEQQHRSPSVIARLMGLQPLQQSSDTEPFKKAELRRSASESRVSRDLCQYRFVDGNTFQSQQTNSNIIVAKHVLRDNAAYFNRTCNQRLVDSNKHRARDVKVETLKAHQRGMRQRKSFFDSADIFPEPKQSTVYSEIEKRLKMKGINEQSKDLETMKQILEALQLKGLLHSIKPANQINYKNFVYDRSLSLDEYPIVVMKPTRSPAQINRTSRIGGESPSPSFRSRPGFRLETLSSTSPRRIRPDVDRNLRNQSRGRSLSTPSRCESNVNCPNRRRPLSIKTQKKKGYNDMMEQRSVSQIKSPKVSQRRMGSVQNTTNRSPRNKKTTPEIYTEEERVFLQVEHESSTMSESSISTSSQTDTERSKMEYKDGRNLLERCDKLLHSIAELQPSPVSVLDSSFYNEELPPSPIMKRSIDFKADQPFEEDDGTWGLEISAIESNDCDLIYVSEILRASNYLSDESDVFLLLEKQQYPKGNGTSKVSRLQRRLIFDTIIEIVIRKRKLPPWKAVCLNSKAGLQQIWSEFQRIRKRDESGDLFEVIGGVLRKDLAGDDIHGWGDCPIEMAESILDIERLIFKDLIGETILDLATYASKFSRISASCRKLLF